MEIRTDEQDTATGLDRDVDFRVPMPVQRVGAGVQQVSAVRRDICRNTGIEGRGGPRAAEGRESGAEG